MHPRAEIPEAKLPVATKVPDVLDTYPVERYRALREGELSVDEFVDDLVRHIDVRLTREALLTK